MMREKKRGEDTDSKFKGDDGEGKDGEEYRKEERGWEDGRVSTKKGK